MRVRQKEVMLLPAHDTLMEKNDVYLFAGDTNAKDHLEYIVQNSHEFHYALFGREEGFLNRLFDISLSLKQKEA